MSQYSLDNFSGAQRKALEQTINVVTTALPGAVEVIAWGMPTLRAGGADGPNVISVTGFKKHNSIFPHSGSLPERMGRALDGFEITKGTIHFPIDQPFPPALLKKILKARIAEINESFPKKNGTFEEYYDNGFLKARGKMKGNQLAGAWSWFRRDGSLMRTGNFRNGEQSGEWVTYARSGSPAKVTQFT